VQRTTSDIANATRRIHAQLVLLVHLDLLAPTETLDPMARKATRVRKEPARASRLKRKRPDVANVPMDRKDPTDRRAKLEKLASQDNPAAKEPMENRVQLVPVELVNPARLVPTANLDPKANPARMRKAAPRAHLDRKERREVPERKVETERKEPMEKPDPPDPPVQLARKAPVAKMAKREALESPAKPESPVRMLTTVLAHTAPRKPRRKEHQYDPSTLIGQHGFGQTDIRFQISYSIILVYAMVLFSNSDYSFGYQKMV